VNQKNRHRYRKCQISNDWSILNSLVNNIRYTKFFMFGLGKFSPNIDEMQILIIYLHIWPPMIKKVEQLHRLFLVVWQKVRRSMQIYWKIGLLWYGAPTGGAANVLLELIFGQKWWGAILEFFSSLIAHGIKTRRAIVLVRGTLGECWTMYSNATKTERVLTHYATKWRQTCELFSKWAIFSTPPPGTEQPTAIKVSDLLNRCGF